MPRLASANSKNSWRGAREETEPLGLMLAFGDVEIGEVVRVPYEAAAQGDPASARQVTLGELQDFVGDLGADDALYLDGTVSDLCVAPACERASRRWAGMIVVRS